MKKILRKLHLWLAFPVGLIVTVLCLTGAVLVFRAEIEEAIYPERHFVKEQGTTPLPLHDLMPMVNRQLENDAATGISISSDPKRTYAVSVASDHHRRQYVNPYSGELIPVSQGTSFFMQMLQLHRWLLVKPAVGRPVTGWTTLLFVIILLTGATVIFPKSRKGWKRIFSIHANKGWKRFWYDLHLSAGMYSLLLLLLLSLTGLTWSFRWYSSGVYKIFGVELPAMNRPTGNRQGGGDSTQARDGRQGGGRQGDGNRGGNRGGGRGAGGAQPADFTHWQSVYETVKAENPNHRTITVTNASASVVQKHFWGNARANDSYAFDPDTGDITDYKPYKTQEKATKIRGWLYTLHVGAWGGWFSKLITCIASLVGASLPVTGYYIWWKKRKKTLLKSNPARK
jgi:uncharacterized iron-regulated membrane protein